MYTYESKRATEKKLLVDHIDIPRSLLSVSDHSRRAVNPFIMTSAIYQPGQADLFLEAIQDEQKKTIARAELFYYRGKPDKAIEEASKLDNSDDVAAQLGAFLIKALSSLTLGSVTKILQSYFALTNLDNFTNENIRLKKTRDFFNLYFNVVIHNRNGISFPRVDLNAFAVPEDLKSMSIQAYAHYLQLCGDTGRAIGLTEGALVFMENMQPIPAIYCALITAVGYINRGNWDRAEYYFMLAWKLAKPDRIISPFSEYRGLLSGLLEKCLRNDYPEDFREISEISAKYHRSWVRVHNSITGDTISDKLTANEHNIAILASRGHSNSEIAEFLDISINSVRAHLRNIFNKLGIDSRKKLNNYVIK